MCVSIYADKMRLNQWHWNLIYLLFVGPSLLALIYHGSQATMLVAWFIAPVSFVSDGMSIYTISGSILDATFDWTACNGNLLMHVHTRNIIYNLDEYAFVLYGLSNDNCSLIF